MPLVRRGTSGGGDTPTGGSLQDKLHDPSADVRWKAARALGDDAASVAALSRALADEREPRVREAIFTSFVRIRTEESGQAAATFIRKDDAALRTAALDALAAMPEIAAKLLPGLLADNDTDVRILSCDLARNLDPDTATRLLSEVLRSEVEPNVCGAAVEVLAAVGTADAIPFLRACKARFPGESFLGFAIDDAVERAGAGRLGQHD